MDAYIRNLHRDGVPKEEEEEPKEVKESEGKYKKRFDLLWFDWSSVVIHAFPEAKWVQTYRARGRDAFSRLLRVLSDLSKKVIRQNNLSKFAEK